MVALQPSNHAGKQLAQGKDRHVTLSFLTGTIILVPPLTPYGTLAGTGRIGAAGCPLKR